MVNAATAAGYQITGIILQQDDGVLVNNRLQQPLPVIDEVQHIDRIPLGMLAAVEVALPGKIIETLSNPYGIATVFDLNAEETKNIVPMARALIGNRSAVVVKTPPATSRPALFRQVICCSSLRGAAYRLMWPPGRSHHESG